MGEKIPVAMAIAGHDPSGASGILRDIRTFEKLNVYGLAVITAVTVQNVREVKRYHVLPESLVAEQIDALIEDQPVKFVKVGMVGSGENARIIAKKIREYGLKAIVDPVMKSSSGAPLIDSPESLEPLIKEAYLITPNVPEAEILSGEEIKSREDVMRVGRILEDKYGCVIIKGGHLSGEDFLFCGDMHSAKQPLLPYDVRGTGCTYSSAITAFLARGYGIREAFVNARLFIQKELEKAIKIGNGRIMP